MSETFSSSPKAGGNRRQERARAFQVVYSLFFSPVENVRDLGKRYSRTIYAEAPRQESVLEYNPAPEVKSAAGQTPEAADTDYATQTLPDLRELRALDIDPEVITPGQEKPFATEGFAWELVQGVWHHQVELDKFITKFSQNWRLERMGRVELALLRLAAYELLCRDDVPPKVIINEAIELSKLFGDDSSRNFVNGILDAAVKALESGQLKRGSTFWGE